MTVDDIFTEKFFRKRLLLQAVDTGRQQAPLLSIIDDFQPIHNLQSPEALGK